MILLDALYINNSGGRILLDQLVEHLHRSQLDVYYLLDARVKGAYSFLSPNRVSYLPAGMIGRHRFYQKHRLKFSKILCFGNIPPSLRLDREVYTYFHNVLYLDTSKAFSLKGRLLLKLKSRLIRYLAPNTHKWWVQSDQVRQELFDKWGIPKENIRLMPFFPPEVEVNTKSIRQKHSFLYVSDGHPYKQHRSLLKAFSNLQELVPSAILRLTISDRYPALIQLIGQLQQQGIRVENLGWLSKDQLVDEYHRNYFLVYPSLRESFGLGLVEAAQAGMCVVGADLPYTHAVIEPSVVFEPNSPTQLTQIMFQATKMELPPAKLKVQCSLSEIIKILSS